MTAPDPVLETEFTPAPEDRWFEDYRPGSSYEWGSVTVEAEEIVAFARRYDPQTMHTDPAAAAAGRYHGLIASGWQTTGLFMRLFVTHYLSRVSTLASPGVDEVRWLTPVRPGDRLRLRVTVLETRRSRSKPDRWLVRTRGELLNQEGGTVLSLVSMNLFLLRDPSAPA